MTKSELIENLKSKLDCLSADDVAAAINAALGLMREKLAQGERIEIRGFGSFTLHDHPPRLSRNPKTGAPVEVGARRIPRFKPGKALRERVNSALQDERQFLNGTADEKCQT